MYISLHYDFHVQLGQELGVCRSLLVHYIKSLPIEGLMRETAERMGLRITGLTNVANQDHMQHQNMQCKPVLQCCWDSRRHSALLPGSEDKGVQHS